MLHRYREDLICDMAETYHILDPLSLPARQLAIYACGLREDSRVVMRLTGRKAPDRDLILAAMLDRLSLLVWTKTKDAVHGRHRPDSVLNLYLEEKKPHTIGMETGEDFERFRQSFFEGGE